MQKTRNNNRGCGLMKKLLTHKISPLSLTVTKRIIKHLLAEIVRNFAAGSVIHAFSADAVLNHSESLPSLLH